MGSWTFEVKLTIVVTNGNNEIGEWWNNGYRQITEKVLRYNTQYSSVPLLHCSIIFIGA